MAGFASVLIAAVVLGLASNTNGAITTVQLHRKNAKLDHVATRSDRNVVCAPPPTALRCWGRCCELLQLPAVFIAAQQLCKRLLRLFLEAVCSQAVASR